jgi:DNA-directed RNA polymerase subunit RPC12/RpoP
MMAMRCPKCNGVMNFEEFLYGGGGEIPWSYEGWRCVYCGEIVDPLILLNREESKAPERQKAAAGTGRGRR